MGLFENLFGRRPKQVPGENVFRSLTAYTPTFTSWRGALYESELVRSAIDAKARHISKLEITVAGGGRRRLHTAIRTAPNEWMTWSQFLYRVSTILDMQNTAFIIPVLDEYGEVCGYYPVLPSRCTVVDVHGEPWLRYTFHSGQTAAIAMRECGILTKYHYDNDFFGSDNRALDATMDLISMQNQGIKEGIRNSATYRFMARLTNFAKPEDLTKERQRFSRDNFAGETGGGVLLFPNTYSDVQQIKSAPFTADAAQMELIRTNVFNYFGVNMDILQNKAIGDALDGFFDGCIEPFMIQLAEVLTRMTFTARELAAGNRVIVSANKLQYMSTASKVSMAKELGDRGALKIDEIRDLFNLPPLEDGLGQHIPARGEYYMLDQGKENEEENANDE